MKGDFRVGGKPTKGDPRDARNWCGKASLVATNDGDQFLLAAIYRALFGNESECRALRRSLVAEAK